MVALRTSARSLNAEALSDFKARLKSCVSKFDRSSRETREAMYSKVELETVSAIDAMREEVTAIQREVREKYGEEAKTARREMKEFATRAMEEGRKERRREMKEMVSHQVNQRS